MFLAPCKADLGWQEDLLPPGRLGSGVGGIPGLGDSRRQFQFSQEACCYQALFNVGAQSAEGGPGGWGQVGRYWGWGLLGSFAEQRAGLGLSKALPHGAPWLTPSQPGVQGRCRRCDPAPKKCGTYFGQVGCW